MINIRDQRSGASVHPQYNILNVMYPVYVQVFNRIKKGDYPEYIKTLYETNGVTQERIDEQQTLIADLLEGLLSGEFERDDTMSYLEKALQDCRWEERFDAPAMAVFDILASRTMLACWFEAVADMFNNEDIRAQSPGELRRIIKQRCDKASQNSKQFETRKDESL